MSLVHLFVVAMILVPAPVPKKEGWTGQIAMLKKSGVPYRQTLKDGTVEATGSLLMIEYRVMQDKGEELVVVENGKDVLVRKADLVLQSEAIIYFTEVIEKEPNNVAAYAFRGWAWKQHKSLDNALKDYDRAIELSPGQSAWRNNRALIWIEKKDYDKAIADYDESIKLFPQYGLAYRNRGNCWLKKKEYEKALIDFKRAIELNPDNPHAYNSVARVLATCPVEKVRDGKQALEAAKRANEMSAWKNGFILDTYAAAFAERGDFDEAIKWQEKAFADPFFVKEKGDEARKRLQLYRDKKPYRETPE
jgi:tetratricopeptide (TPR) repeat protein